MFDGEGEFGPPNKKKRQGVDLTRLKKQRGTVIRFALKKQPGVQGKKRERGGKRN